MKQIELVIQNETGLHARPAKVLVNLAKQFKSNISLQHKGKKANAKSMVSVLTLGAVRGSGITLQVEAWTRKLRLLNWKPPSVPVWETMTVIRNQNLCRQRPKLLL